MSLLKSGGDGNMITDRAQYDLTLEIADSERQRPWPSGIYAKTLYRKQCLRAVLISMEAGARMKEHHVDGTSSLQIDQLTGNCLLCSIAGMVLAFVAVP